MNFEEWENRRKNASSSSSSSIEEIKPACEEVDYSAIHDEHYENGKGILETHDFEQQVDIWAKYWEDFPQDPTRERPRNPLDLLDIPQPRQYVTINLPKDENSPLILAGFVVDARLHFESVEHLNHINLRNGIGPETSMDDVLKVANEFVAENVYFYVEVTEIRPGTTISKKGKELYYRKELFVEDQAPSFGIVGGQLVPDTYNLNENFRNLDCAVRYSGWYPISKLEIDSPSTSKLTFNKATLWSEMIKTPAEVRFGSFKFPINHLLPKSHKVLGAHREVVVQNRVSEILILQLGNFEMYFEAMRKSRTQINHRLLLKEQVLKRTIPLCYTIHVCHLCIATFNSQTLLKVHEKNFHQSSNPTNVVENEEFEFHNYFGNNPADFTFCKNLKDMATYFLPYKAGDDDCVQLMEYWTLSVNYSAVLKLIKDNNKSYNHDATRKLFGNWNGKILAGFFCRQNDPACAVSAVLVFPPFMKLGFGSVLLEKGMNLAKGRCITGGSLERPFSQGGHALVIQYMRRVVNPVIVKLFLSKKRTRLSLDEIQKEVHWVTIEDLAYSLVSQGFLLDKHSRLTLSQFVSGLLNTCQKKWEAQRRT